MGTQVEIGHPDVRRRLGVRTSSGNGRSPSLRPRDPEVRSFLLHDIVGHPTEVSAPQGLVRARIIWKAFGAPGIAGLIIDHCRLGRGSPSCQVNLLSGGSEHKVVEQGCASADFRVPAPAATRSRAMATSRHAWPSPIGELTIRARFPLHRQARDRHETAPSPANPLMSSFTFADRRAGGRWPGQATAPLRRSARCAHALSKAGGGRGSPWMTRTGHLTFAQTASVSSTVGKAHVLPARKVSAAAIERVGDRVLDLLRRVRLGKHLHEPELP